MESAGLAVAVLALVVGGLGYWATRRRDKTYARREDMRDLERRLEQVSRRNEQLEADKIALMRQIVENGRHRDAD